MKIEYSEIAGIDAKIEMVLNKQFEIIKENIKYEDIPEDGLLLVKKKKIDYRHLYRFKNEEEYQGWKKWAIGVLEGVVDFNYIDMIWGLSWRVETEKPQLSLGL